MSKKQGAAEGAVLGEIRGVVPLLPQGIEVMVPIPCV